MEKYILKICITNMRNKYRVYYIDDGICNTCNLGMKTDMNVLFIEFYPTTVTVCNTQMEKLLDGQQFTVSVILSSATCNPPAARRAVKCPL